MKSTLIEAYGTLIYFSLIYIAGLICWIGEGCPINQKSQQITEPIQERIKAIFFPLIRMFYATLFLLLVPSTCLYFLHSKYGFIYPNELVEAFTITIFLGVASPLITFSLYLLTILILNFLPNHLRNRRLPRD